MTRGIDGNRFGPREIATTATSLAAFSTTGRLRSGIERAVRETQARKRGRIRRAELEPSRAREVERRERRVPALGIREGVLNRQPHVRDAKLRDQRTVDELDHRVHDRLRMNDARRFDRARTPNSQCASITSRPLFINVAESIVILRPMRHVGCFSASAADTSRQFRRGSAAERSARMRSG